MSRAADDKQNPQDDKTTLVAVALLATVAGTVGAIAVATSTQDGRRRQPGRGSR
jgi:hypothetical protein